MTKMILALGLMAMSGMGFADHLGSNSQAAYYKAAQFVDALLDAAYVAEDLADDIDRYDYLEAKRLNNVAKKAEVLATRVETKVMTKLRGRGSVAAAAAALRGLAIDYKNLDVAVSKLDYNHRALASALARVDRLTAQLEDMLDGRSTN